MNLLNTEEMKWSYNDIKIIPSVISEINSRSECSPYDDNGMLPIFAAPMTSIVNENNADVFRNNGIYAIIPRSVDFNVRIEHMNKGEWVAMSLNEFEQVFVKPEPNSYNSYHKLVDIGHPKVCIDVANGHMKRIFDDVKFVKEYDKDDRCNAIIMTGNIANPETYIKCCEAKIDYVRCGIGSGSVCITSTQTAVHYPMASLINGIKYLREIYGYNHTKVIADGGIRNYDDVIKALALGADYVMIGGLFGEIVESAGHMYIKHNDEYESFNYKSYKSLHNDNGFWYGDDTYNRDMYIGKLVRSVFGMSSSYGQIALNGMKTKTSEGTIKYYEVKYTLPQWVSNMKSYMQSAMSYSNARTLDEFRENAQPIIISNNTYNSINK